MKFIDRVGEENYNTYGTLMKIVEYNGNDDVLVEFQDEYRIKVHTNYWNFKMGQVKNPYNKTVYEVGYLGIGKYEPKENKKCYNYWKKLLERNYDPYKLNKCPTYIDCYVCNEWLCFQNFAEWFYKHYYEIENERMELDKDILFKGNKIYSPKTCIFVPHEINSLFIKSNAVRGKYPIGVCWHKASNKFTSQCSIVGEKGKTKRIYLGLYNTAEEAFLVYKNFKENYIKQIANKYKDVIPKELYEALYKYEVEIND